MDPLSGSAGTPLASGGDADVVERAGAQGAVVGGRLFVPGEAGTLTFEPTDTLYIYSPLDTAPR